MYRYIRCQSEASESASDGFPDFKRKMEDAYHKWFPNSRIEIEIVNLYGPSIVINCYLANGRNEEPNGYFENDMFHVSFFINLPRYFDTKTDPMPESMALESESRSYLIKPPDRHLAYGSRKVPFRKTTGDSEKLIRSFGNFVGKLYSSVSKDLESGEIHEDNISLLKSKI